MIISCQLEMNNTKAARAAIRGAVYAAEIIEHFHKARKLLEGGAAQV